MQLGVRIDLQFFLRALYGVKLTKNDDGGTFIESKIGRKPSYDAHDSMSAVPQE